MIETRSLLGCISLNLQTNFGSRCNSISRISNPLTARVCLTSEFCSFECLRLFPMPFPPVLVIRLEEAKIGQSDLKLSEISLVVCLVGCGCCCCRCRDSETSTNTNKQIHKPANKRPNPIDSTRRLHLLSIVLLVLMNHSSTLEPTTSHGS